MCLRAASCLFLCVAGTAAAAPLDPAAFEALAENHTLHFTTRDGAPFGAEQYFPGRRSVWQYLDGSCAEGVWWPEGDEVCFSYGPDAPRECWSFEIGPTGTSARLAEGGPGSPAGELLLHLAGIDRTPLDCPGPYVGT